MNGAWLPLVPCQAFKVLRRVKEDSNLNGGWENILIGDEGSPLWIPWKPSPLWGCWLMWAWWESFNPVPPDPGAAVACAEEADPREMWVGWKLFLLNSSTLCMSTHSSSGCQRGKPGVSAHSMTPYGDGPLSAPKGWEEVSSPYWHLPATQCLTSLGSK